MEIVAPFLNSSNYLLLLTAIKPIRLLNLSFVLQAIFMLHPKTCSHDIKKYLASGKCFFIDARNLVRV